MSRNARRIIFLSIIFILIAGIVFLILKLVLPRNTNQNKPDNPDKNNSNIYTVVADNVDIDDSTGLSYVNNEILLNVTEVTSREDIERIVSQYDGVIVGYIDSIKQYQIELGSDHSYAELEEIGKALTSFNEISSSGINHVMYLGSNNIPPNDSEWKNEWNDDIGGKNWGVEAIQAPKMWELMDNVPVSTVNVGVLDNQFYTEHEDLDFTKVEYNNYSDFVGSTPSHGTHVSGTIAAVSNNEKGIAGVMPNDKGNKKVNLYGVSIEGLKIEEKNSEEKDIVGITVSNYEAGLVDLIALKGCKVINLSYGGGYSDEGGIIAQQIEDTLQVLIDEGHDFLIIKSAGNDSIDYEDYDLFSQMNNQNVLDRIITIGATKLRDGEIFLWEGSNYGKKVDIVAPGCDIYSTIADPHNMATWTMWIWSSYKSLTGTSMASPHVTGVAAALLSVDPNLSGTELKDIICSTATGDYHFAEYGESIEVDENGEKYVLPKNVTALYGYPMLNAYEAMRKVIGSTEDDNDQEDSQYTPTQVPTEKTTSKPTDPPAQQTIDDNFLIGDWSTSDGVYLSFYDDGTFIMDWGYFPEEEGHWTAEATTDDTLAIEMDGSSILSMMSMLYGNTLTDYHFEILKCNNDNFYLVQVYDDYTARTSKCKLGFTRDGATKNFSYQ